MIPVAVILYEDQRGPQNQFGLHDLVLACVADELGCDVFALREKLDGTLSLDPLSSSPLLLSRMEVAFCGTEACPEPKTQWHVMQLPHKGLEGSRVPRP